MVGVRKECSLSAPALTHHHTLNRCRCAHRCTVDGSGNRVGSLQCGDACSTESPPAIRSQDCCRHRRLYFPDGASQSGKIVKVYLHGRQIPHRTQVHAR